MEQTDVKNETQKQKNIFLPGLIYFSVNTVILISLVWKHTQKIEFLFLLLVELLLWYVLVHNKKNDQCASVKLPFIIFMDILLLFVNANDEWRIFMTGNKLYMLLINMAYWIPCVIIGIIFWGISCKKNRVRFQWIALEFFGLAFVATWGAVPGAWSYYIQIFFLIYSMLSFVWCCAQTVAVLKSPKKAKAVRAMTLGLLAIFTFFKFFVLDYLEQIYFAEFPSQITMFLTERLGVGKVIFFVILIGVAAVFLLEKHMYDALGMAGIACAILVLKASTVFFTPFNVFIMFIYGLLVMKLFKAEKEKIEGDDIGSIVFLVIYTAATAIVMALIHSGLWIVVVLSLIFVKILFPKKGKTNKHFTMWVLTWFLVVILFVLGLQKVSMETSVSIILIYISFIIMLCFLNWKHPAAQIRYNLVKTFMCLAFGLFMILSVTRSGTKITYEYNPLDNTVSFSAKANGKDNYISELIYYYSEQPFMWEPIDEVSWAEFTVMQETYEMQGISVSTKCLVVETIDKNMVKTRKKIFLPAYYYTRGLIP